MKPSFQMPGYRINEYQLVLNPPEVLRQRIGKVREGFSLKYDLPLQKPLKAVCLVKFSHWEMMEEKILHRLQLISMRLSPFKIEIRDFGSLPSHSVFLDVVTKVPVQKMVRSLKTAGSLLRMNSANKPQWIDNPHIPIAYRLKPWQYEQGWKEYSHRQFTAKFIADHILLLKRPAGERHAFQVVKRFDFQDLPVLTTQGSFFEMEY